MFKSITRNLTVLKKAIKNGEPISYVFANAIKKLLGLSQVYKAKLHLSENYGYNIYLNKLYDRWENEKNFDNRSKILFVILSNDEKTALGNTLTKIKQFAAEAKIEILFSFRCEDVLSIISKNYQDYWVIFLKAGDEIFPWTLSKLSKKTQECSNVKAILFDHDYIINKKKHNNPHLKPYYNKRYLLEYDYVQNAIAVHQKYLTEFSKDNIFDAIYFWLINSLLKDFEHIQLPLLSLGSTYTANYMELISESLKGNEFELSGNNLKRSISFLPEAKQKVSIIIPFRDKIELLKACISSILTFTSYPKYEIVLADNNSSDPEILEYIKKLISDNPFIKHLKINSAFNFSFINNEAVKSSSGEFLLFLNNDTEAIQENWLSVMIGELQRKNVGAVGPMLLYEDGTIQHAGVVPGIGHVAGHIFRGFEPNHLLPMHNIQSAQEVAAVTGACLLTKKTYFEKVDGFDQDNLKIAYNDVDFCFKLLNQNLKIIFTPKVKLLHFESKSRKFDMSKGEKERYNMELDFMNKNYQACMKSQKFYHPAFSIFEEDYSYNISIEKED